jgi:hypothetical protein
MRALGVQYMRLFIITFIRLFILFPAFCIAQYISATGRNISTWFISTSRTANKGQVRLHASPSASLSLSDGTPGSSSPVPLSNAGRLPLLDHGPDERHVLAVGSLCELR